MNALAQPLVVAAVGFMAAGFFIAASRTSGDRRRSWIAFGCGGLLYLAAELWWGVEEALGAAPSVSLADLLWLSAFPCYFAALYLRNRGSRQSPLRVEDWIECVLVMGACAEIVSRQHELLTSGAQRGLYQAGTFRWCGLWTAPIRRAKPRA